ncbi:Cytochrome [Forsythia ovata]|uniref:Cytochrome n=1 Tax=Forsythia ovata TaxID=205694 RepID=A0ABD1W4T0_9LAMI
MMEFQFPLNFTSSILLLFFIFLLLKARKKLLLDTKNSRLENRKLPPGPWRLPVIGHLHHISSLPHRSFKHLSNKYGPIMHLKLGEVSAVVVSSSEIAKDVLKVRDPTFADRPENIAGEILWYNSSNISFSQYGDYWRQMRKICILELLSAKNVKSFGSIRKDEVSKLVQSIRGGSSEGPINLTEKIFGMTSSITCRAAFGKICRDKNALIDMFKEGITLVSGFDVSDLYPSSKVLKIMSWNRLKLLRMRRKLDLILDDIIDEHNHNLARNDRDVDSTRRGNGEFGNEDLVDVLLRVKGSGELEFPITNDNVKAVIYDIFAAGTETSSTTIDWIMAELIRNPRVMAKVQAEIRETIKESKSIENDVQNIKYLKMVIKEGLRLHAPVPLIPRVSREDTEIEGYHIPARTKVLVNAWAMGRDPEYWSNPESFEPERFENNTTDFTGNNFEFIPFGAGRRMCPGMTFGLASVELPLAHLLYHFDWKLPDGMNPNDLDMNERPAITAARRQDLHLVAIPHDANKDQDENKHH